MFEWRSWWCNLYLYWSNIYLKLIHPPNVLRPVFFVRNHFLYFLHDYRCVGVRISNWDLRSFLWVFSCYISILRTFLIFFSRLISYLLFVTSCSYYRCLLLLLLSGLGHMGIKFCELRKKKGQRYIWWRKDQTWTRDKAQLNTLT